MSCAQIIDSFITSMIKKSQAFSSAYGPDYFGQRVSPDNISPNDFGQRTTLIIFLPMILVNYDPDNISPNDSGQRTTTIIFPPMTLVNVRP